METSGVALLSSHDYLTLKCVPFHKGVIWLLLATVAEVPPVVSLASFHIAPFR